MVGVNVAEKPLLRSDHPAFILNCKICYLKYILLDRRVKRFDFGRAAVDGICAQLTAIDWCAFFKILVYTIVLKIFILLFVNVLTVLFLSTAALV
jgi:hypothetical protein